MKIKTEKEITKTMPRYIFRKKDLQIVSLNFLKIKAHVESVQRY
jgi:hypothetical protein